MVAWFSSLNVATCPSVEACVWRHPSRIGEHRQFGGFGSDCTAPVEDRLGSVTDGQAEAFFCRETRCSLE